MTYASDNTVEESCIKMENFCVVTFESHPLTLMTARFGTAKTRLTHQQSMLWVNRS